MARRKYLEKCSLESFELEILRSCPEGKRKEG
jgi:hypothetical protein